MEPYTLWNNHALYWYVVVMAMKRQHCREREMAKRARREIYSYLLTVLALTECNRKSLQDCCQKWHWVTNLKIQQIKQYNFLFANIFVNGGSLSTYRSHERKSLNRHFFLQLRLNSDANKHTRAIALVLPMPSELPLKKWDLPRKDKRSFTFKINLGVRQSSPNRYTWLQFRPPITWKTIPPVFQLFLIVRFYHSQWT